MFKKIIVGLLFGFVLCSGTTAAITNDMEFFDVAKESTAALNKARKLHKEVKADAQPLCDAIDTVFYSCNCLKGESKTECIQSFTTLLDIMKKQLDVMNLGIELSNKNSEMINYLIDQINEYRRPR